MAWPLWCWGGLFLPFVFGQPRSLQWPIIVGGLVYVGSALGLEFVELHINTMPKHLAPAYFLVVARMQEFGEIIGLTIFATGMLSWLSQREPAWLIALDNSSVYGLRKVPPFRANVWATYLAMAIFTASFQLWWRSIQCIDACSVDVAKAMIWGVAWPLSWIAFLPGTLI